MITIIVENEKDMQEKILNGQMQDWIYKYMMEDLKNSKIEFPFMYKKDPLTTEEIFDYIDLWIDGITYNSEEIRFPKNEITKTVHEIIVAVLERFLKEEG